MIMMINFIWDQYKLILIFINLSDCSFNNTLLIDINALNLELF